MTGTGVGIIDDIAEAQIRRAVERGDFDNLPGAGKPLLLEDDTLVPEELRMAYRVLKMSGFIPEEVSLRRDIRELEQLLSRVDGETHAAARRRLELLRARLNAQRGGRTNLQIEDQYQRRVLARLQGPASSKKRAGEE